MKLRKSIFLLFLIMAITSCLKEEDLIFPDGAGRIVGRWQWVGTHSYYTNTHYSPASTGEQVIIQYYPEGRFMRMKDDEFSDGNYSVTVSTRPEHPYYLEYTEASGYGHATNAYFYFEGADTLRLIDDRRHASSHTYVRVR